MQDLKPQTIATSVSADGMTALIQNLGRDCSPLQFVREYVQNGIEAVQRTGEPGKVIVDLNEDILNTTGVYKISFLDTGDGMTCDEMRLNLNNLSASGGIDNQFRNYGMGAKIASLTRNHAGIFYESVKNGEAHSVNIGFDIELGSYGITPDPEDGSWCVQQKLEAVPEEIKSGGTRVTLFGMIDSQDTMQPPVPGLKGGVEYWLTHYVNTRFFEVPSVVDLRTRVGYQRKGDSSNFSRRKIVGQKATLEKHAEKFGTVSISDAKVHWWILQTERKGKGREYLVAHSGVVNQGETFELADGTANRCPAFGVIFGKQNVVLYVEPSRSKYTQNTSRTSVVGTDGSALPWNRWAQEFRAAIPVELADYMETYAKKSADGSNTKTIKDRLKSVAEFFNISAFRLHPSGKYTAGDNEIEGEVNGTKAGQQQSGLSSQPAPRTTQNQGESSGNLAAKLRDKGRINKRPARKVTPDSFPKVIWESIKGGTRAHGDGLDDRAAMYHKDNNLIVANADFKGFTDLIDFFVSEYSHVPNSETVIVNSVQEAFEQNLTEVVTGALSLDGREQWQPGQIETALSPESLTAATMPRFHTINQIRRQLGSKLGKIQPPDE